MGQPILLYRQHSLHMTQHPAVAGQILQELSHPAAAGAAWEELVRTRFVAPSWTRLADGLRPSGSVNRLACQAMGGNRQQHTPCTHTSWRARSDHSL